MMGDEKKENLFNLAENASLREREKSIDLGIGYSVTENTWEVIVRYIKETATQEQSLYQILYENLKDEEDWTKVKCVELWGGYAILTIPESMVNKIANLPMILFMEKPKRFFFV